MPMPTPYFTGVIAAKTGATLMARLRGQNGALVTQASLSSIAYVITNLTTAASNTTSTSLTISSVISDSLVQNDPRWTQDSEARPGPDGSHGYNMIFTIPSTSLASSAQTPAGVYGTSDQVFQVDVRFTPVTGQPFNVVFRVTALKTFN